MQVAPWRRLLYPEGCGGRFRPAIFDLRPGRSVGRSVDPLDLESRVVDNATVALGGRGILHRRRRRRRKRRGNQ